MGPLPKGIRSLIAAALCLACTLSSSADTIHVPDDYTLKDAVAHASAGDTVLIAPGTYNEGTTLWLPSGITLMSEDGNPASVKIGGGNSRRVLRAENATGLSLVGVTIKHGKASGLDDDGAGFYCVDSQLSLDRVVFYQNTSESAGGGLYCTGSVVELTDCTFDNNEVGDIWFSNSGANYSGVGAGMYLEYGCTVNALRVTFVDNLTWSEAAGMGLRGSSAELTDCSFINNVTYEPWGPISPQYGGAILVTGGQLDLRGVTFERNFASTAGGAIDTWSDVSITIEDCSFIENEGGGAGGALHLGLANGSLHVRESTFIGNVAGSNGGGAAWVRCVNSPCEFASSIFAGNESSGEGGALKNWYGPADVTNCTFFGNSAPGGSDLVYRWGASGTISNSILGFGLEGPPMACPEDGVPEVMHCYVFGNATWDSLCGVVGDNAFADPLFCNAPAGDFSLCSNSDCLPSNNPWGELVGALGEGCGPCYSAIRETSWGSIKAMFR